MVWQREWSWVLSTPADIRHDILRMMFGITGKAGNIQETATAVFIFVKQIIEKVVIKRIIHDVNMCYKLIGILLQ